MKKILITAALLIPLALGGCLLDDRTVEIVLSEATCEPFVEYHESENYTTPKTVEVGENVDDLLAQNDFTREDIISAYLISGSYEVTEFEHDHDWTIEGTVTVERTDIGGAGPVVLFEYENVSLESELGSKNYVTLLPDGIALVNDALADWIAGADPVLQLTVVSDEGVTPSPSPSDALSFTWEACLYIQVTATFDTEMFTFIGGE
jgi:hypothetical protein